MVYIAKLIQSSYYIIYSALHKLATMSNDTANYYLTHTCKGKVIVFANIIVAVIKWLHYPDGTTYKGRILCLLHVPNWPSMCR